MRAKIRRGDETVFFVQAEDGIRDYKVTGVQTCALSIWADRDDAHGRDRDLARAHHLDQPRSKEHTSELQSPCNLVCRLLLEQKTQSHYTGYGYREPRKRKKGHSTAAER